MHARLPARQSQKEKKMKIASLIKESHRPFVSLEFFPPAEAEQLPAFFETVEELRKLDPLFVSVTYGSGGGKKHNTLAATTELAKRGLQTMAHLTCVGASEESLANFLAELSAAGVNNVLALRGDPPRDEAQGWDWNKGDFRHASDLVKFIKRKRPEMGIAVAAYTTPHPESVSWLADRKHLADKFRAGAEFAITQLFFDARDYEALRDSMVAKGIDVPIIPGIMPIRSFDSLRRILSLCGASIPAKLYLGLEQANEQGGVKAVQEAGIDFACNQIRQLLACGAPGIHIYSLNKADLCLKLARSAGLA